MTKTHSLLLVVVASFTVLFRDVIAKLIHDWSIDENYSHGFLVVPMALYFAWERHQRFVDAECKPSTLGLLTVFASIALLLAGVLGAEVFTTELSMLGAIAGSVLYLGGWKRLKVMLFPIAFLILMIPIPTLIFNQIAFPLQLLASSFGETALAIFQIPVLREGNVIHLANISLEVAEACSGIRSLISLLTLGIVYGYFMDGRNWVRVGISLATIPVAIISNGFRVAGTGIAAHYYGTWVANGFLHTFSGWMVFVAAFAMLFLIHRTLIRLLPNRPIQSPIVNRASASRHIQPSIEGNENEISNSDPDLVVPVGIRLHCESLEDRTQTDPRVARESTNPNR